MDIGFWGWAAVLAVVYVLIDIDAELTKIRKGLELERQIKAFWKEGGKDDAS